MLSDWSCRDRVETQRVAALAARQRVGTAGPLSLPARTSEVTKGSGVGTAGTDRASDGAEDDGKRDAGLAV